MCSGDVYTLSCGHTLVHYRSECRKTRCGKPGGEGSHHFLADTCAKCDPEFRASQIGRKYRAAQSELTAQLTEALKARRADEVARIHDELERLRERTNAAIGEEKNRRVGTTNIDGVEYPTAHVPSVIRVITNGGPEAAGYTSRWIDGKNIWMPVAEAERQIEEEQRLRVREGKPRVPVRVGRGVTRPKVDPLEYLNRKLDEQRLARLHEGVEEFERRLEADARRKAEGKKREEAASAAVAASAAEAAARTRKQHHQLPEPEDPIGEHTPLHPLRHKKKIAAWLPTPEELDELAECMSEMDFDFEPEPEPERRPSLAGESSPSSRATTAAAASSSSGKKYVIKGPKAKSGAPVRKPAQEKAEDEDGDIWLGLIDAEERKRKAKAKAKSKLSPRAMVPGSTPYQS